MTDESPEERAAAKRARTLQISRTIHSIPVEEGGRLRPAPPPPPPEPKGRGLVLTGAVGLALGFAAGLFVRRGR